MGDTLTLKDGTPGWVWPLLPTHRESLVKAFEDLSPESRRLRFLTPVERLSDSMLHQLVDEVDGVDHIALVVFVETETEALPIAIGRIVRYPDIHDAADIAVTVRDDWQGRGVATALLSLLVARRPLTSLGSSPRLQWTTQPRLPCCAILDRCDCMTPGWASSTLRSTWRQLLPVSCLNSLSPESGCIPCWRDPVARSCATATSSAAGCPPSTGDAQESTTGPAQSEEGIDPEALDKTI
ncbi:MAG: GNAT family N-acetyltransferase [Marmoricola sp.]